MWARVDFCDEGGGRVTTGDKVTTGGGEVVTAQCIENQWLAFAGDDVTQKRPDSFFLQVLLYVSTKENTVTLSPQRFSPYFTRVSGVTTFFGLLSPCHPLSPRLEGGAKESFVDGAQIAVLSSPDHFLRVIMKKKLAFCHIVVGLQSQREV